MPEQITLYTAKVCPYAQRVELALEEAGAKYDSFQVDLQNKPEWYAPKVNPASKVPAVAYGGPAVPADQPSPESVKIAESAVLLEFVADLYPEAKLLPADPVSKAKVRFFIDAVNVKFVPGWVSFVIRGESPDNFFAGAKAIQSLLPDNGKYSVGDHFTIADAAILPFLARLEVTLTNGIGAYEEGQGEKVLEILKSSEYSRLWNYYITLKKRANFQATFDEPHVKASFLKRFSASKAQKQAA